MSPYEVIGLFGLGVVVFLGGLVRVLECEGCGVRAVGDFFEFFSPFRAYFVVFAFFVVCVDGFSVSGYDGCYVVDGFHTAFDFKGGSAAFEMRSLMLSTMQRSLLLNT